MNLPVEMYSVDGVRQIDRQAIDAAGISGYTLMTRAAQAAMAEARTTFPAVRRWQVLCGAGNNGGDGYVLARLAAAAGIDVSVVALAPPETLRGDAATACDDYAAAGGRMHAWEGRLDPDAGLLVDALFGSGLSRAVEGEYAEVVRAINRHPGAILSLDVPSGLSADTGEVLGVAVRADVTVTFVGLKCGLLLGRGPECVGRLRFAGLDIPENCKRALAPCLRRIDEAYVAAALAPRRNDAHKGNFGHVLVVGGAAGMGGAVRLAAEAALTSGAGRVTVATLAAHCTAIHAARPELMCLEIDAPSALAPLLARATVIAVGPGLGTDEWGLALWDTVRRAGKPMVVDADALNLLARNPATADDWILTPHPGEAGRLLGRSTVDVQADRLGALADLAGTYGGTAVLKGPGTLVSARAGAPFVCTSGNPGMASAGMGDVLTGVIAGLLAQGLSREEAAACGVEVHGRAGDLAAGAAPRGLLATNLLARLRECVNPRV